MVLKRVVLRVIEKVSYTMDYRLETERVTVKEVKVLKVDKVTVGNIEPLFCYI